MRKLVAAFVLVAGTGCEDPCVVDGPVDACHYLDPAEPGPFPVGVTTVTFVDESRRDASGAGRLLKTELWYPATEEALDYPRDRYDLWAEAPADVAAMLEGVSLPDWEQDAARDAPLDAHGAPYPLLVFSHGKNGVRFQTASLMVHLASHGYVVAAPDHWADTLWDLLRDPELSAGSTILSLIDRPRDVSFVGESVDDPRGPLGEAVDGTRWGVFGHSFGGLVSVAIVARGGDFYDDRVDASLPLAPAVRIVDLLGAGTRQAAAPMLIMGGIEDQTCEYENEQVFGYEVAPAPKGLVGIHAAGHFSFTELCAIDLAALADKLELDVGNVIEDGCGPEFIASAPMNRVERYFATAFFNYVLRQSRRAGRDLRPWRLPADVDWHVDYVEDGLAP